MLQAAWLALSLFFVPQEALRDAAEAMAAEDYEAAVEHLTAAVAENPDNLNARLNLAFAHTQLQQRESAIEQYFAVLDLDDAQSAARNNLTMMLLESDRYAEAIPQLERMTSERPDDARLRFFLAHALFLEKRYAEAAPLLEALWKADPENQNVQRELILTLGAIGDIDQLIAVLETAAERDPGLLGQYLGIGQQLEEQGELDKALAVYRRYASLRPEDQRVPLRIATIVLESGDYEEAIRLWRPIAQNDSTAANLSALAHAYAETDQYELAMPLWDQIVAKDPGNTKTRVALAGRLLQEQKCELAANHYLAAVKTDASLVTAWDGLAFCFYKLEHFPQALQAMQESTKRAAPSAPSIYLRAIVEDKLGLYEEALAHYQEFLAAKPGLPDDEWKAEQRSIAVRKILESKGR